MSAPTKERSDARVVPYSVGICMASVCAALDADREEVERELNASYPTGISSAWQISKNETFSDGHTTNPCECNTDPSRRHWLLEC